MHSGTCQPTLYCCAAVLSLQAKPGVGTMIADLPIPYSERTVMPLWRSLHSLNLMLPKEERKAMLLRLYNEIIPLQDNSKARFSKNPKSINGAATSAMSNATVKMEILRWTMHRMGEMIYKRSWMLRATRKQAYKNIRWRLG